MNLLVKAPVLDHGYVQYVEAFGTGHAGKIGAPKIDRPLDEADFEVGIIEAARMSTQGSFRGWETDAKLLKYLYENKHSTPFEFAGLVIEVQAPIFVFREWHRHRTQAYNEMSARYEPLPDISYVPTPERLLMGTGSKNKQANAIVGAEELTFEIAEALMEEERDFLRAGELFYQKKLRAGVPKELARTHLPFSRYSRMRAVASLRNWLMFMTLRCDPKAQWEIQQYSWHLYDVIRAVFPQTARLWRAEGGR